MFYVLHPQSPHALVREHPLYVDVDPEDAYVERKRREYLAALQHQQERHSYERAVAAEEERHRARLAALAQQERIRRHPQTFGCARPVCAPTNIARGRYNRQREAPHFQTPAPAPVPQHPRAQSEEITIDQLFAELFGHSAQNEPDVAARKATQPTALPQQAPRANSTPVPVASTSAAPAPAPARVAPSAHAEKAEPTEGHWSNAVKRTRSVAAISQISRAFDTLQRTFTFPAGPLAPIPGSDTPRIAYNPTNAPIHAYEHALSELLTKLDTVESFGFRGVRELRKEVVVKIEKELEALEKKVAEAIAAGASPVVKSTEIIPEELATEKQADKVVEDKVVEDKVAGDTAMEEAEVVVVVASGNTEMTAKGYDLDNDDTVTLVPAPAPVEPTLIVDSPMVNSEAQTANVEVAQPEADAIAFDAEPTPAEPTSVEPSPTQPNEDAIEAESQEVDSDPIIVEPAVEPGPELASQVTESIPPADVVSNEVVANPTPEPSFQTVLEDTTASSSESESEIEDVVDVTVSSDSDEGVTLEVDDTVSDGEKDFEML